jgi:hypothetical protein
MTALIGVEGTASRGPLIRRRVGMTIVAIFATIVSADVAAGMVGHRGVTEKIAGPFAQRWNLFAPVPPSANLDLYVVTRDASGHVSRPVDVSKLMRRAQVSHRFDAPRLSRVFTKLAQSLESGAYRRARTNAPPSRAELDGVRRALSAVTSNHVASLRGIVIRTTVRTFAQRGETPARAVLRLSRSDRPPAVVSRDVIDDMHGRGRSVALVFDSGWLRYDDTVAKLRLP